MTTTHHIGLLGLLTLAGCALAPGPQGHDQGLQFRVSGPNDCGIDRFAIAIEGTRGTAYGPEVHHATPDQLVDVQDLDLPDELDAESGLYAVSDLFIALAEGSYDVRITSQDLTESGDYEDLEAKPAREVEITGGATTEIGEVFSCEGEAVGGLDVVIVVNNGPDIVDFWFDPDKFNSVCGVGYLTAVFVDDNAAELDVTWEVYDELGEDGQPDPATLLDTWTDPGLPSIVDGPTESTFAYECSEAGTNYVLVSVTDDAGMTTTFWTMVHCYTPLVDNVCIDPSAGYTVAGTCNPDFPRTPLDAACLEDLLGPLDPPACDEICPDYDPGDDDGGGSGDGGSGGDGGTAVLGNPDCEGLGYPYGFKIDSVPVAGETYSLTSDGGALLDGTPELPGEWVRIDAVHEIDEEAKGIDWTASVGMDLVLLKAGTRANVYEYDPEAFTDTDLYTVNRAREISHVTFCYDDDGPGGL